ncbi:MAG: YncE family protein [Chitinophagaceae bacterium]
MKRLIKSTAVIMLLQLFLQPLFAQVKSSLKLTGTFHIASDGGWDYLSVSPTKSWLYVSHGTQVNILDKSTGDSVGFIPNTTGVHGIAFDPADGKGFTSNGRLNTVTVFDLNDNKITGEIKTGENPDAIFYEPFSKKVITCNGRSKDLSIIDPASMKVINTITLDGKPETAVSDGKGKLFVNIEDKNEIAAVDLSTGKVISFWSIAPGEGPTGLAYDNTTQRLFAGCDDQLIVLNATNGKVVTKVPIGAGCDGVAFDPTAAMIFTSNGEGTMTAIHEESADKYTVIENFKTKRGARTICIDPATHKLYLPTADFDPVQKNENGRPKMIPGSFQVLVISQ